MGEVASLRGGPTGERVVEESCVEHLRDLLEKAESGEIVSISYAVQNYDRTAGYGCSGGSATLEMVGAAHVAASSLAASFHDWDTA